MIAGPRFRSTAPLVALMLSAAAALCANPFLPSEPGKDPIPSVRAPSSSGPAPGLQIDLREKAAQAIRDFGREGSAASLLILLGASFAYGILHAAGPGHRKTVLFSIFLGKKAAPWEPAALGFLSALVHAATGMAIVLILSAARGAVAGLGDTERIRSTLDAATFAAIALIAAALIAAKVLRMRRDASSLGADSASPAPSAAKARTHAAKKGAGALGIVIVSSLAPCPGATMILLFSMYAELLWLGAVAVLAMSIGMGCVVSGAGYLAYAGRTGLFGRLKAKEATVRRASDALELVSYAMLFGFAAYMLWPILTAAA